MHTYSSKKCQKSTNKLKCSKSKRQKLQNLEGTDSISDSNRERCRAFVRRTWTKHERNPCRKCSSGFAAAPTYLSSFYQIWARTKRWSRSMMKQKTRLLQTTSVLQIPHTKLLRNAGSEEQGEKLTTCMTNECREIAILASGQECKTNSLCSIGHASDCLKSVF